MTTDKIPGGLADGMSPDDFDQTDLEAGMKVEMEHTEDSDAGRRIAQEIAMDHLSEDPLYYHKLEVMEAGGCTPLATKQKAGIDTLFNDYSKLGYDMARGVVSGSGFDSQAAADLLALLRENCNSWDALKECSMGNVDHIVPHATNSLWDKYFEKTCKWVPMERLELSNLSNHSDLLYTKCQQLYSNKARQVLKEWSRRCLMQLADKELSHQPSSVGIDKVVVTPLIDRSLGK